MAQADPSDPDVSQAAVDRACARLGGVDILVNNAGIGTAVPAKRETREEFRSVVDVNLCGRTGWRGRARGDTGGQLDHDISRAAGCRCGDR